MSGFIERDRWNTFLNDFSKRNQLRTTRLEFVGPEIGVQEQEARLPLVGISLDTQDGAAGSVAISLGGETAADPRHLDHMIGNVERITPLFDASGLEEGLGFEDKEGNKTLLRFESPLEIGAAELSTGQHG
jgi:Family of unknown function (DUF5335)